MKLSQHDLQQLDEDAVCRLPEAALRHLSLTLLADLKEARERLAQNPHNSSRPPSSRAPWDDDPPVAAPAPAPADTAPEAAAPLPEVPPADSPAATPPSGAGTTPDRREGQVPKRKAGKQVGAPGVGRTQVFTAHHTEEHRPTVCARCGQPLRAMAPAVSYTGFQALDLDWGDPAAPGLRLRVIDHRYFEVTCTGGHHSRSQPAHGEVAPELDPVAVREWRLVGPGLATLIVALNLRFRLSRARIREFLHDWLGVQLSVGTIHQTLHEVGAVVAPAEAQLLAEAQASGLLHADETSWPQPPQRLWLWVFITTTTTLYVIAGRGKATVVRLLTQV
jgi:transposase